MSDARTAILERLKSAPKKPLPPLPEWQPYHTVDEPALARFRRLMEAVRGEVVETTRAGLIPALRQVLAAKGVRNLFYGLSTELSQSLEEAWKVEPGPELVPYDRPIEELKALVVNDIDASITTTKGAIADIGSLIVWPSAQEPRLMSLVPPIHIAVLEASRIFDNFAEALAKLDWTKNIPSNTLLISGPSKTADIEGILCYGVHGPKQLVVLVVTD